MDFTAGQHKQAGLSFSPLKALISPRPIGWISSISPLVWLIWHPIAFLMRLQNYRLW